MHHPLPCADTVSDWVAQECAALVLGDRRRVATTARLLSAIALRPAGTVTQVFAQDAAGQQAAYDWAANPAIPFASIATAAHHATASRCALDAFVYVPVDGTDLTYTDTTGERGTGPIADGAHPARGFFQVSALAVSPDGVTAGLCARSVWVRPESRVVVRCEARRRPLEEKESWHYHRAILQAEAVITRGAPNTRPWFQIDRAGDTVDMLLASIRARRWITVRACYDRKVISLQAAHLKELGDRTAVAFAATLALPACEGRDARVTVLQVRYAEVQLRLCEQVGSKEWSAPVWTVWVREVNPPANCTPITWTLHTTRPVECAQDALEVVNGYCVRWRIEEFHRTWKSGGTRVEDSQLRDAHALWKWGALLSAAATRLMRLRDLSRTTPASPAKEHFSAAELEAIVALRDPRDHTPGQPPTLGRVVRWLAELGGYAGSSAKNPPGVTVLARGMERVEAVVTALENMRRIQRDP